MDSLPIELIEEILRFTNGSTFTRCSTVCKKWLNAKINIERTDDHFWKNCCKREISKSTFDELNNCKNESIDGLTEDKCKTIYIQWFRGNKIKSWSQNRSYFSNNSFAGIESVTALANSGSLIISGHRSGRVLIIDPENDVIIDTGIKHLEPVNDLALIDIKGRGHYELFKDKNYPTKSPSFSSHHHIITASKDSTCRIFPVMKVESEKYPHSMFEITSLEKTFLSVKVCNNLMAVSAQQTIEIGIFTIDIPKEELPFRSSLKVECIKKIDCRNVCPNATKIFFGLFTFSDLKIIFYCHESERMACIDVEEHRYLPEDSKWNYKYVKPIETEVSIKYSMLKLRMNVLCGFAFSDGIFFLITNTSRVFVSYDSQNFKIFPIHSRLKIYDKIITISKWGSIVVYGTERGFLYVEDCPSLTRLPYITHYEPLFAQQITEEPITKISINDNGFGPVIAAATKQNIVIINWRPNLAKKVEFIDLVDSDEE